MKVGSVCSGVCAPTLAWKELGFKTQWFCELEPFPSAVLSHHYPHIPNHGDMWGLIDKNVEPVDVLVGGTPCQSFSIAGKGRGLADRRGLLSLLFPEIAFRVGAQWAVWENVPKVLTTDKGETFAAVLSAFTGQIVHPPKKGWGNAGIVEPYGNGFGVCWRVLDAKGFGTPQQRRRIFIVGYKGNWRPSFGVLFERSTVPESVRPSRKEREGTSPDAEGDTDYCIRGNAIGRKPGNGGDFGDYKRDGAFTLTTADVHAIVDVKNICRPNNRSSVVPGKAPTLTTQHGMAIVNSRYVTGPNDGSSIQINGCPTLVTKNEMLLLDDSLIRWLTPIEFERLQGFPDDFTKIPWNGKPASECPKGHRYKAMGNSIHVGTIKWIGRRIKQAQSVIDGQKGD